jgi:hypothetical protein
LSGKVTFREATEDEKPYLLQRLSETPHEQVSLEHCWVAEQDGKVLGMLPIRLVWQAEPLIVFEEVTNSMTRRRAMLGLYIAMETWLADRSRNKSGVHWYFAVMYSRCVQSWAKRLGLWRIYKGSQTFVKHL